MLNRNCNYLTNIAISVIISFILALLFYIGIIIQIMPILIFSLVISILSLFLIGLLGISDNGLTRNRLCQNCINLVVSVIGNILFNLINLSITLTPRYSLFDNFNKHFLFFLYIKFNNFNISNNFNYTLQLVIYEN